MTRLYETGTHPFYIGMYIHIYTHTYVHIYILLRRNVYVFFPRNVHNGPAHISYTRALSNSMQGHCMQGSTMEQLTEEKRRSDIVDLNVETIGAPHQAMIQRVYSANHVFNCC